MHPLFVRPGSAANTVSGFEEDDFAALLSKAASSDCASPSCSDDQYIDLFGHGVKLFVRRSSTDGESKQRYMTVILSGPTRAEEQVAVHPARIMLSLQVLEHCS
jgi:hypothetical protein